MADETTDPATAAGLGSSFFQQPALDSDASNEGSTLVVRYAGDYDAVRAYAATLSIGSPHPDATNHANYVLSNIRLERYEGPSGRLELTYTDDAADSSGGDTNGNARVKSVAWSLVTTPCDVPIWRYCGPSDQNARRYRIEPWTLEQDPDLKSAWKYTDPNGVVRELTINDQKLAGMIAKGYETVQRHYPTIRKITKLSKGKVLMDGELDHVATAQNLADAPEYFLAQAEEWLKTGEQIDIDENGSQTLTEEWTGGSAGDGTHAFEPAFYGESPDRWEFGSV